MSKMKKLAIKKQEKTESKADKFNRLAIFRLNKAIAAIEQVSNLSVKTNYDYTERQVISISDSLHKAVNDCMKRFQNGGKSTAGFTL